VIKLVKDRKAFQIWLMNAIAWKGKEEDCAPPNFSYALNFVFYNWWGGRGGLMLWPHHKFKAFL
jgi:hypothetical protein